MRLRYTAKALVELDEILTYIGERSPQGARKVQRRIARMMDLLVEHPHSGRRTNKPPLRRLVVTPYPYLVFYELRDDEVIVIGLRHGARRS